VTVVAVPGDGGTGQLEGGSVTVKVEVAGGGGGGQIVPLSPLGTLGQAVGGPGTLFRGRWR
jgi:hypothetical protein